MREATMRVSTSNRCPSSMARACTNRVEKTITSTSIALRDSTAIQEKSATHEGVHMLRDTSPWDPYREQHQFPFDDAAEDLLK